MSEEGKFEWGVVSEEVEAKYSLKDDLTINSYDLEYEWRRQPYLCYKWGTYLAEAEKEVDIQKNRFEVERSNLDAKVRTRPQDYGIDKVTETAISRALTSNRELTVLQDELVEARRMVGIMSAAFRAIEHKKYALQDMSRLWLSNYYSKPDIPQGAQEKSEGAARESIRQDLQESVEHRRSTHQ